MKGINETTLFIIEPDKLFSTTLKNEILKGFDIEEIAISVFEAGEQCALSLHEHPDIAIVEFHMNSRYKDAMNGIKIIDMIKAKSPNTEIIMFTREDNVEVAKKAFNHGAYDYVVKNGYMFQRLNVSLRQCLMILELKRELKSQKTRGLIALVIIAVLLSLVTTIQIFAPHLL